MTAHRPVPYQDIDTLFLDAGNTILHMDYAFLSEGFRAHGFPCQGDSLARAEAASRPALSRRLARGAANGPLSTEGVEARQVWVESIVRNLPVGPVDAVGAARGAHGEARTPEKDRLEALIAWLWSKDVRHRTWTIVPAGLVQALERLKAAGYKMVVVSNADGNVESWIRARGLRHTLDAVVDSGVLGIEKPHPGIFEHALTLAGSEPSRAVHVGDLYSIDVAGARAAGCHAILLDPFGDWGGGMGDDAADAAADAVADVNDGDGGHSGVDCDRAVDVAEVVSRLLAARTWSAPA